MTRLETIAAVGVLSIALAGCQLIPDSLFAPDGGTDGPRSTEPGQASDGAAPSLPIDPTPEIPPPVY